MTVTAAELVNRALVQIGAQYTVTGTPPAFDGSAAGAAAGVIYVSVINLLLRKIDPEFAVRVSVALTLDGNTAPSPWAYEYAYPADCIRLRQVAPASPSALDPQPVRWEVAEVTVSAAAAKAIMTNQVGAVATYTSSNATETLFDWTFQEAAVRMLASDLAMGVAGRPDLSKEKLAEAGAVAQSAPGRDS